MTNALLPSLLKEDGWIKITPKKGGGSIGFHCYYGQTLCFAMHDDGDARDTESGILISDDPDLANRIYEKYEGSPHVTITRG